MDIVLLILIIYYFFRTPLPNGIDWKVHMVEDYEGPWCIAIDLVRNFQDDINALIKEYNEVQTTVNNWVHNFDINSDSIDLNMEMDRVLSEIKKVAAMNATDFPIQRLNNIIKLFSNNLLKLQLHLFNASVWRFDKMQPILDFFYRYDATGEKIERSPNNYRTLFSGKHYYGYFFKVRCV